MEDELIQKYLVNILQSKKIDNKYLQDFKNNNLILILFNWLQHKITKHYNDYYVYMVHYTYKLLKHNIYYNKNKWNPCIYTFIHKFRTMMYHDYKEFSKCFKNKPSFDSCKFNPFTYDNLDEYEYFKDKKQDKMVIYMRNIDYQLLRLATFANYILKLYYQSENNHFDNGRYNYYLKF